MAIRELTRVGTDHLHDSGRSSKMMSLCEWPVGVMELHDFKIENLHFIN